MSEKLDADLKQLAELINRRNRVVGEIAALTGRPAQIGHLGEYIAARIFDIELEASAVSEAIDGHFRSGPLEGRSVNVRWYPRREGLLDLTPAALPDAYLVLTGPKAAATSSRAEDRPWVIEAVFLFDAGELLARLTRRGVQIGIATSVAEALWARAEIYPGVHHPTYRVDERQWLLLSLFGAG